MFHSSHETYVDCLKRHLKAWKMRGPAGDGSSGAYSDATISDFIVEAHERIGGPAKTGIVFGPGSADEYNRRKANSVRIMRMLTDEPNTEFESLQLFNFAPSILAAMPADLRTGFLNEYLASLDLAVRGVEKAGAAGNMTIHLVAVGRETSEAIGSIADLVDGATRPELVKADRELAEAEEAIRAARADVRNQLTVPGAQ